jgi:hypothetical protein
LSADAEVIATNIAIKVIAERSLLAIIEQNTDQTSATNQRRGHFFDNHTVAPFFVAEMNNMVPKSEIESWSVAHSES